MGLKAPNFYRKDAENERSYFLGSGGVLFREFSWVCFGLGFFVVVVCGVLVDFLWWYLCICLPSRSPFGFMYLTRLAFGVVFCSIGSRGKLLNAF